jgi:hypothetical protein
MKTNIKLLIPVVFVVFTLLINMKICFSMSLATNTNLDNTIVKLSYLGPQNKPVDTLLFSTKKTIAPIDKFKDHNVFYDNDAILVLNLIISEKELSDIIDIVNHLEDTKNPSGNYELSVVVFNAKIDKIDERKLDRAKSQVFYQDILGAIKENKNILDQFKIWGTRTGFDK